MADVLPNMVFVGLKNTLLLAIASTLLGIVIGMILAVMGISRSAWIRTAGARLYRYFPRPAGDRDDSSDRPGPRALRAPDLRAFALSARHPRAQPHRGRLYRRNLSLGHPERRTRPAGGLPRLRDDLSLGMRLVVIPQGVRRVLPALVNQFIGNIKDSSLVYFLGLLASERELFRVGQDEAVVSGNLSPLMLAGIFYLLITVPLTHVVNAIDSRLRAGRRIKAASAGLRRSAKSRTPR
jgi:hypothetical protein